MYRIGELAKLANVTPDTIRYYEKQQMIDHEVRTEGGFRLYTDNDLQRLRFIRYARQLGFTLDSIRELLSIRIDPAHQPARSLKALCRPGWMKWKHAFRNCRPCSALCKGLNDACCGTAHSSIYCSILEALEQGASGETEDC